MVKKWFEVYTFNEAFGSQTIQICETKKEAEKIKKESEKNSKYKNDKIYIDKWKMETEDSIPEQIELI